MAESTMNEFEAEIQPYILGMQHEIDKHENCITLNVNPDRGMFSKSLRHLAAETSLPAIFDPDCFRNATKLYVVGEWVFSFDHTDEPPQSQDDDAATTTREEDEWHQGMSMICNVISKMLNIKELTWISTLPFTSALWPVLPLTLTKLIVDFSQPIALDPTDNNRPIYIHQDDVKPLISYTKLTELRIFGLMDAFQAIIWETVFRSQAEDGAMRVLDINTKSAPIVREGAWKSAGDVGGLDVPVHERRKYKGNEGRGILHHDYGTGEYLDDYCMRKARLASGIDHSTPLPLRCLKLDGFVIDHLPFEESLSSLALLSCGENCIDAGIRAPKNRCMMHFPNWCGVFEGGELVGGEEVVVAEESGLEVEDVD